MSGPPPCRVKLLGAVALLVVLTILAAVAADEARYRAWRNDR